MVKATIKKISDWLDEEKTFDDGRTVTKKTIYLNIISWLLVTGLFTYITISLFKGGQYLFGFLSLPITLILLAIPFKRDKMQERLESAILSRKF